MQTIRWLVAAGCAAACFTADAGYWFLWFAPFLIAARIHLVMEPRWDMEAELESLLND